MEELKDRILKDGKIRAPDILRVDSFLNHQIDVDLGVAMADAFYQRFQEKNITKVLTIEASGIALGCFTAQKFKTPLVFAKKSQSKNLPPEVYTAKVESFTHGKVYDIMLSKEFLHKDDRIFIVDDFLANGAALKGLLSLVEQAGATVEGVGIAIEKAFQTGGKELREQGIEIYALARVQSMSVENGIIFAENEV